MNIFFECPCCKTPYSFKAVQLVVKEDDIIVQRRVEEALTLAENQAKKKQ